MNIQFYCAPSPSVTGVNSEAAMLEYDLKRIGAKMRYSSDDCLCKREQSIREHGLDLDTIVLCHPHSNTNNKRGKECWAKIKGIVEANPTVQFYFITLSAREKIAAIGEHPNVTYIVGFNETGKGAGSERLNCIEAMAKILNLPEEEIKKKLREL